MFEAIKLILACGLLLALGLLNYALMIQIGKLKDGKKEDTPSKRAD